MHLEERTVGKQPALPRACIRMMSVMFKITQNALRDFSLGEVLLMAAMNELEAKQKGGARERSLPGNCLRYAKAA